MELLQDFPEDGNSLQTLLEVVAQETTGTVALAETVPMQVKIMPVASDYWGLSPLVPQERQPKWKEVQKQDMAGHVHPSV